MQFLKEAAANERRLKIRILTPADDLIVQTVQTWTEQQKEQQQEEGEQQEQQSLKKQQQQQQQQLQQNKINVRFIEPSLQTKVIYEEFKGDPTRCKFVQIGQDRWYGCAACYYASQSR
jgi:hypothetical protein